MLSIYERSTQDEILDGDAFDFQEYETTMRQLETINHLTMGYAPTLNAIQQIAKKHPGRRLRVLDIGFGGGDMLRAIARWAHRTGLECELVGVDLNPWAKEVAERATPSDLGIRFVCKDAFALGEEESFDVVINALFMHHLSDRQIIKMIRWMTEHSKLAWFVNDLHRHPVAYHFIKHASRAAGWNRMIQNDAPLSVARSFRKKDWLGYLSEAGLPIERARIRWHWSFRYGILYETEGMVS